MHDPVLLIGYMVAVSLTADFVVRRGPGYVAAGASLADMVRVLAVRPVVAGLLMLPIWLIFGVPGFLALALVALPQGYLAAILQRRGRWPWIPAGEWSPAPAVVALAGQAAKAGFILLAWLGLREAAPDGWLWTSVLGPHPGLTDTIAHWTTLAAVGWSLLVVNTRAASFFVSLLLPPDVDEAGAAAVPEPRGGYTVKLGPLAGRIEPDGARPGHSGHEPDAVGATIGGLERLLVVVLILGRAEVAIGLVVAAKTLARFKQLDERHFAERYLVGTLASITIAVASAMLVRLALTGF